MDKKGREKLIGRYADGPGRLGEALAKAPERMRKWRPEPGFIEAWTASQA